MNTAKRLKRSGRKTLEGYLDMLHRWAVEVAEETTGRKRGETDAQLIARWWSKQRMNCAVGLPERAR